MTRAELRYALARWWPGTRQIEGSNQEELMRHSPRGGARSAALSASLVLLCGAALIAGTTATPAHAGPDCTTGQIIKAADPSLSAPSPTYVGNTITSTGGSWTSCAMPFTGNWTRWLRNGVVVAGPTWSPGLPGFFFRTAQAEDIGGAITSQIQPCNADGCYPSYAGSTNSITTANRAPNPPTNLVPADGTTGDSTTPTLSATFSDPDGQTGYTVYTVRRTSDNVVVATGNGPFVASGQASVWTVTSGVLIAGTIYTWSAQNIDSSGWGSGVVTPGSYGADPVWMYPACATDGSPDAEGPACGGGGMSEPAPIPDTCDGADGFCDATLSDLQAAGIDTTSLESSGSLEMAGNPDLIAAGGKRPTSGFTGRWAYLQENLILDNGNACANQVVDSGHCADLWHAWVQLLNGEPMGPMHYTHFRARSGDNNPSHKWIVDTGPMPDVWASSLPSDRSYHHWGWQFGHYQGYWPSSDVSFYPGLWPLDPWNVYSGPNRTGVHRNAFEIHGGWQGHQYEVLGTHGCLRIRYQAITTLRAKWITSTDNKMSSPGPTLYHYYQ
jgi:hypothetical protein